MDQTVTDAAWQAGAPDRRPAGPQPIEEGTLMAPQPLTPEETEQALAGLPHWTTDGDSVSRSYSLPGHLPAAAMAMHIAALQEELDHHSELTLGYNTLSVTVNTHSVGGRITELDIALARRIEEIAPGHGAS
ncbi:4a-hydroxytetrahydrobiopterin dehydratase [Streptomyces qinglanensis]